MELGYEVGIQQKSAWLLKRKAQVGMQPDKKKKIDTAVHADEFMMGGKEKASRGAVYQRKKRR